MMVRQPTSIEGLLDDRVCFADAERKVIKLIINR